MKSRPKTLVLLALINFAVALSLPIQIMVIYGHGLAEWPQVLDKLTILNWGVMAFTLANGVLIYMAAPIALLMAPLALIMVGLNNYFVGLYATDYTPFQAGFAFFTFSFCHWPLVAGRNMNLFANPTLRWWRVSPRKQIHLPISLGDSRQWVFDAQTYDVSETGAFVPLDGESLTEYMGLDHQKDFRVRLNLGDSQYVTCQAQIVRRATARGQYPAGLGIQFGPMAIGEKRALKNLLNH
ncbi:MAG: PilZ domain-containing protein [Bdellovibrionales bacterium]